MDFASRVIEADDRRIQALLSGDARTLAEIAHPNLIYVHHTGRRDTYQSYIDALASGRAKFFSIVRQLEAIVPVPCGCVVHGIVDVKAEVAGVPKAATYQFSAFWLQENDSLRLMLWASTQLERQP
jgi:hypothetical protein